MNNLSVRNQGGGTIDLMLGRGVSRNLFLPNVAKNICLNM